MSLEVADNIWCELQRVCRAVGYNPQIIADRTLLAFVGLMEKETYMKSVLGAAWEQEKFHGHPAAYFATFDLAGTSKLHISDEVSQPFAEYAQALGYDPSKLANQYLGNITNALAKKHLGKDQAAFSVDASSVLGLRF